MVTLKTTAMVVFFCIALSQPTHAQEEPSEYERVNSGIQIEKFDGQLPGASKGKIEPRAIIQVALDLIKVFEGWSSKVYDDPAGYCTIGYGHLIAKAFCADTDLGKFANALSKDEGNLLLAADTREARFIIQELVKTDLNKQQFGAITSFVFNVGGGNFAKSTLLRMLNDGEHELVAKELRKWTRAKGKILPGLIIRRNCEVELYRGEKLARLANGQIDTASCGKSLGGAPDLDETIDITTGESFQ